MAVSLGVLEFMSCLRLSMELLTCFTRVGSRNMSHFRAGVFWVSFWIYGGGGVVSGVD